MSCVNGIVGPYGIRQFGQAVHRELTTGKTSIDLAETCAPVRQSAATPGIWNPLPLFGDVQRDYQLGSIRPLGSQPRPPALLPLNPPADSPSIPAYFRGKPPCAGCTTPPPAP